MERARIKTHALGCRAAEAAAGSAGDALQQLQAKHAWLTAVHDGGTWYLRCRDCSEAGGSGVLATPPGLELDTNRLSSRRAVLTTHAKSAVHMAAANKTLQTTGRHKAPAPSKQEVRTKLKVHHAWPMPCWAYVPALVLTSRST